MPLFNHPPVNRSARDAEATLCQAVGAIVERARQRGLLAASCWSLAELCPEGADYAWLNEWAGSLASQAARRWLCDPLTTLVFGQWRLTCRACLGCLLLMLASEAARREATEGGTLWPYVRRSRQGCPRFGPDTEHELFQQGQPTELHKDALEDAARRLQLRHAFGMEDVQHYYASVSLQYGFSQRGLQRRLPDWLAGQGRTHAIERLLAGPLYSASFSALWDHLTLYRRSNIKEQRLRQFLDSSPWILPTWIDDLVKRATDPASGGDGGGTTSDGEEALPFLDEPVLHWDGGAAPRFTCRLINLALLDLVEDCYDVILGGRRTARLFRQADENYTASPAGELSLPVTSPSVAAALVARGQVVASQELRLWNPEEDVTVYRLPGGRRLDCGEAMSPQTSYALLAARDLSLTPPMEVWQQLTPSAGTLRLLPAGWSPETRLCAGEVEVWRPPVGGRFLAEPDWALRVRVHREGGGMTVALEEPFDVRIDTPAGVEVRFARWQGQPIDVRLAGGGTLAGPVSVSPAQAEPSVELVLGLRRDSESMTVRRPLVVLCRGGARLDDDGWKVLTGDDTLTVDQARLQPCRLWPPDPAARLDEWAILEGNVWVGRPSRQPRPLGSLAGFGAELRVVRGPYNLRGDSLILAHQVIDAGSLRGVSLRPESRTVVLHLADPIELDDRHHIIWWGRNKTHTELRPRPDPGYEGSEFEQWVVDWPEEMDEPLAVALAYDGFRLGTWCQWNWADPLLDLVERTGSRTLAGLIRWLALPVLERVSLPRVRELALEFPAEVLTAWLFDAAPQGLRWGAPGSGWLPAVAEVFSGWRPRSEQLHSLLHAVASLLPNTDQPALFLLLSLLQVDPLLMARVTRLLLKEPLPGSAPLSLDLLTRAVAQLDPSATDTEIERVRSVLPAEIAPVMGVDSGFVSGLVREIVRTFRQGQPLRDFDAMNYAVGVAAVEPFRRLVGLHLLAEF
jgi:hypothetical protein